MIDLLKYRRNILGDYDKLIVSVSGGRTSMFMARFIQTCPAFKGIHKKFIFANTGKEREETLEFVQQCDNEWSLGTVWVEADIRPKKGKGTSYKIVNFETASRNGEPFERLVNKYGIPNKKYMHCTRELKAEPIRKVSIPLLGHNTFKAIGIRNDERNRVNRKTAKEKRFIYPLVDIFPVNEPFIRSWWNSQTFDLQLDDYEGNCDLCWKKSLRKRLTLIKENPSIVEDWERWEKASKYVFDRDGYTIPELIELSKQPFKMVIDKHKQRTGCKDIDTSGSCHCKF